MCRIARPRSGRWATPAAPRPSPDGAPRGIAGPALRPAETGRPPGRGIYYGERKMFEIRINDIMKGDLSKDIKLQRNDTIIVMESFL